MSQSIDEATNYINGYRQVQFPSFRDDDGSRIPIRETRSKYVFGFELELMGDAPVYRLDDYAFAFTLNNPDLSAQMDSSLGFNGFELVSHPATIEYYRKHFSWDFLTKIRNSEMFVHLDGRRSREHFVGECGLHIHMNKSVFDDEQHMLRWAERMLEFLEWAPSDMKCFSNYAKPEHGRESIMYDRFVAVSLNHLNTVEVRAWRPALSNHVFTFYMDVMMMIAEQTKVSS